MPDLDNEGVIEADSGEALPMGDPAKQVGRFFGKNRGNFEFGPFSALM